MPYIGNNLATQFQAFATQTITGDNSTSYTLDRAVANGKELLVYINNVKQEEGSGKSYTATGTTITFSAAVTSSDSCYVVFLGSAVQTVNPPDASVGSSQLASSIDFQNITIKGGSTNAMTIDSTGRILTPARPSFCARPTAEITNQTSGDIVFGEAGANDEASHGCHNVGGHYSISTGKFTAPVTGIYFFSFSAMTYAENDCEVKMYLNTQDVIKFNTNLTNDESNYESFHGSTVIKMSASDFFHPQVAGGNFHASPNHSQFSGFLIG